MSYLQQGLALGAVFGLGLVLVWRGLPVTRRHTLADRVLPYLRDQARPSTLLTTVGMPRHWTVLSATPIRRAGMVIDRVFGDAATVRRRLQRAGQPPDVAGFRAQQVMAGVGGAGAGLLLAAAGISAGQVGPFLALMLVLLGAALGVVVWDQLLSRRARRREERMLVEFPTIAEFLALAVGAGEGAVGALDRVSRLSQGELAGELRRCLADARAGASLPVALAGLADRTGLPSLARFVDGIVIAVERGTPLAEVLRAQAQDVRENGRRVLMESAGRKEIAMMVPVVFLILPLTIVFALFPGLSFFDFTF
ncbi:MAG TPA: type II secretion system F family protein [Phycicoccus sp.]|nr:type II secretion system F family protein [Phycicoccus sp.]